MSNDKELPKRMHPLEGEGTDSHSRGYRNKFNSSFLWLIKSNSDPVCIFILGNPYRGVLRVLTISSIFPPTLKCSYNCTSTANPLLSKQGTGFCLLFANCKPARTKEPYLSVWACDGDMGTCCYDNNMRLNHPDRQDPHNCVITCSRLFKGNFISAAESTLEKKA